MNTSSDRASARRAVPEVVAAQVSGAFAGLWLAIGHIMTAAACFVTIIGIPFGIQHVKLAGIALAPIGKTIVSKELAAAVRGEMAQQELARRRG